MKINIIANIPDRWVNHFCSLLRYMEYCGNIGHSCLIGFYSDGDGDFRPKFEFDTNFELVDGYQFDSEGNKAAVERFFDAG